MKLKIGDKFQHTYEVTEEKIQQFGEVSEDFNPVHFDEEYAKKTVFKGRIAHGMLSAGFISSSLVKAFGDGVIYLSQNVKFLKPVRIGETVEVILIVTSIINDRITVNTICRVNNSTVIDGAAKCMIAK